MKVVPIIQRKGIEFSRSTGSIPDSEVIPCRTTPPNFPPSKSRWFLFWFERGW